MTASKMKKYPILASKSSSSLLPTNHQIQNPSSTSSSTLLLSSTASFRKYNCGETSSPSSSSCSKRQISDNYLSSSDELRMIDDRRVMKQVGSLFDQSMHTKSSVEMCRQESELHLTRCHGVNSLGTTENNTVTSHSLPSDRQLKKVVNKNNIQQHIPHWRWKRWYETWLCIRQIGQIKSKEASSSTRASTMALNTYYSLSSWLSHFTTLLVVLSVMPFGVQSGPEERRLINDLLDRYQTLERPVFNESEPLNLKFGLTLQQIIDVDEKNQLLTTNVWLNLVSMSKYKVK